MKQRHKVWMLPTDKGKGLISRKIGGDIPDVPTGTLQYNKDLSKIDLCNQYWESQHLYITSNEEIKEGDSIVQVLGSGKLKLHINVSKDTAEIVNDTRLGSRNKVIATTNPKLWNFANTGYTTIEPLGNAPAKIPQSLVEAYVKQQFSEVELEYSLYGTCSTCGKPVANHNYRHPIKAIEILKLNSNGEVIWSLVEDKPITLEDMYSNMQYYMEYCQRNGYITPQDWLDNHKHL